MIPSRRQRTVTEALESSTNSSFLLQILLSSYKFKLCFILLPKKKKKKERKGKRESIRNMPYLEVNGRRLHYTDLHPKNPPSQGPLTFIFIHGLGASENYFFPILPHIADHHRCITFDMYGSARSLFTGEVTSIDSIAADVRGILDSLHVPQAIIVGHSMGGIVANLLGARFKDRVQGIVGIGPTHPTETARTTMRKRGDTVSECSFLSPQP